MFEQGGSLKGGPAVKIGDEGNNCSMKNLSKRYDQISMLGTREAPRPDLNYGFGYMQRINDLRHIEPFPLAIYYKILGSGKQIRASRAGITVALFHKGRCVPFIQTSIREN